MRSLLLAAIFIFFTAAACESPWAVELESPIAITPEEYRIWYAEVAECMGISSTATPERFAQIRWYSAVDIYNSDENVRALGLWTAPHRITVRSDRLLDPVVVKHEIVHDLLADGEHPQPFFERCAGK